MRLGEKAIKETTQLYKVHVQIADIRFKIFRFKILSLTPSKFGKNLLSSFYFFQSPTLCPYSIIPLILALQRNFQRYRAGKIRILSHMSLIYQLHKCFHQAMEISINSSSKAKAITDVIKFSPKSAPRFIFILIS